MAESYLSKKQLRLMPSLDSSGIPIEVGDLSIDLSRCTGCGLCISACPSGALEMPQKKQVRMVANDTGLTMCFSCADCVATCEPGALSLRARLKLSGFFEYLHRGELSPPRKF